MGCGITKEKLEDEIMKTKLERVQIQAERIKQMNLLEEIGGLPYKCPIIPDYIESDIITKKKTGSFHNNNNSNLNIRIKQRRSKSQKIKTYRKNIIIKKKKHQNIELLTKE